MYILLFALSMLMMMIYQYSCMSYASNILVGCIKNKIIFIVLALLNTVLFGFFQVLNISFYFLMLSFLLILTVEFKLISKADNIQVFCGASIFVLHISALITPMIVIFSNSVNIPPRQLISSTIYDNIIVIISCLLLTAAHKLVGKYIDSKSIQRVTVKSSHSSILLVSVVLLVTLQTVHVFLLLDNQLYFQQILLTLTISLATILIFYLFFLYAISLVDASLYKRYKDKVISEQEQITGKKHELLVKIEKDDLTGVFNRKYAINALEKMCDEKNDSGLFCVLFLDINGLKYTNDKHGHSAGDRLINKIAYSILKALREEDIVARIGGDEFLAIITDAKDADYNVIIDRINENIAMQNKTEDFLVSASIGHIIVTDEIKKQGVGYIMSTADENMRENKKRFYEQNNREG